MKTTMHKRRYRAIIASVVFVTGISGCTLRLDEPLLIRGTVTEKDNPSVPVEDVEIRLNDLRGWPFAMPTISATHAKRTDSHGFYQFEIAEMRGTFLDIRVVGAPCEYTARPVGEIDQTTTIFDKQHISENRVIELDFVIVPIDSTNLPGCLR